MPLLITTDTTANDFYMLDSDPAGTDAPEWAKAWAELKQQRRLPGEDFSEECSETGEVWQYMGTSIPRKGGPIVHEFRHRCAGPDDCQTPTHHAPDHKRRYLNIEATREFTAAMRA